MAIRSRRQAEQLGRLGGLASSEARRGDSAWGRAFGRNKWRKLGGKMLQRHYPGLSKIWIENARRAKQGLPRIPVPLVMTPAAIRTRELRARRRRRAAYEPALGALADCPRLQPRSFLEF